MEITRSGERTTIVLRHKSRWFGFFYGALAAYAVFRQATAPRTPPPTVPHAVSVGHWLALIIAVGIWVAIVLLMLASFVFLTFVKEVVTIDPNGVTMQLKIGAIGISSLRAYRADDIANVSLHEFSRRSRGHLFTFRRIRVDGPGWSARTSINVSREEAEELLRGPFARFVRT
jgi:hypothetical protein